MKKISLEQLIVGRRKVLQNARDLICDAELLYEHQRWARCVFLSSIAIEELGKYLMIMSAIGNVLMERMNWKRFWKRFRSHKDKSGNIFAFDAMLSPFISADDTIKKLHKTLKETEQAEGEKLSSLYVDSGSETFNLPMDMVDKAAAHRALDSAKAVLEFFENNERLVFSKLDVKDMNSERLQKISEKLQELYGDLISNLNIK